MNKYKHFFRAILNFFWLPVTFLISKGKLLKIFSQNNKLLFDKWLSLLEAGINYFFVKCVYCDFSVFVEKHFLFWTTNINEGNIRGLLEKYPTFGREKETGLLGALDT